MHIQAINFTFFVKDLFPDSFVGKRVLDVGSGDINGNNRFLFKKCLYHGNDVVETKNVTIVSKTKDLPFEDESFDTILSTECFEHDPELSQSLQKIYKLLKPDGLFCFTCASTGRAEHRTRRTTPDQSYGTLAELEDMVDYYKNVTEKDIHEILDLDAHFSSWDMYYNSESKDLYFLGIKKGQLPSMSLKKYQTDFVENTRHKIHEYN